MAGNKFRLTKKGEKLKPIFDDDGKATKSPLVVNDGIYTVAHENLYPRADQPRKYFNDSKLQGLADSIQEMGILQPILVKHIGENKYEIIAGERRWRAARMVGLSEVPIVVKNFSKEKIGFAAVIENLQREDLNPLEEAEAYHQLINEFGLTHQKVSDKVGRSRSSITNSLRLLDLGEYAKSYLVTGKLEMGHARALLTLKEELQEEVVNKIVMKQLNVRETEKLVQHIKYPKSISTTTLDRNDRDLIEEWKMRGASVGKRFIIKMRSEHNIQLSIECSSTEDIEEIITKLEI